MMLKNKFNMNSKKSQLAIFIILAFIILFAVIFIAVFVATTKSSTEGKAIYGSIPSTIQVKSYMDNCLKDSLINSMWDIGLMGGYTAKNLTDIPSIEFQGKKVPIYFDSQSQLIIIPQLGDIKENIKTEILTLMSNCTDLTLFKSQGLIIKRKSEPNLTIIFNEADVKAVLDYNFIISSGNFYREFTFFSTSVPISFKRIFQNADLFITSLKTNPQLYNLTKDCQKFDFNKQINIYYKNGNVVQFVDFSTFNNQFQKSYIFQFALQNSNIVGECNG